MVRTQSRIIPGDEIGSVVEWDFGAVDQTAVRFAAKVRAQEIEQEQIRVNEAHQAGFADGYAQGHAAATLEGQRQIAEYIESQGQDAARHFAAIFASASTQLEDALQVMSQGVLELSCELARQVLRHELAVNPNALQPVVREALHLLFLDSKAAVVRLNPLDADMLQEDLKQEFSGIHMSLVADSAVARGGCLVESGGTVVDGTIQKRWTRAVSKLGLESAWEVPHDDQ